MVNIRFESIEHMLSYYAKLTPEKPALIYDESGKKVCTFAQLYSKVGELSGNLKATGKTCLGILTDGSFDCILNIFAANKTGMQVVMLDASMPTEILRKLILNTDVDVLWGDEKLKAELEGSLTNGTENMDDKILFFTSGTTSMAKAVTLTGHSLCQSAYNGGAKLPLTPEDILMCMLPLSHVFGFVCGLLWGISSGSAVAVGRGPRHYIDDMDFFRPTVLSAVPTLLGFLIKQNLINEEAKLVLVGAGDCPVEILGAAKQKGLKVSFGYGLTETSSGVAISVEGDPYAMEICPDDNITIASDGEVLVSAPTCIMQGYYKQPEATKLVLRDGVFHTGDLGRIDTEGKLHITGRKKEILVLGDGTKIFLPEYEAKLSRILDTTEFVVLLNDGKPTLLYNGNLSTYSLWNLIRPIMKQYPRGQQLADIIKTDKAIPRTATGKIKRWELEKLITD